MSKSGDLQNRFDPQSKKKIFLFALRESKCETSDIELRLFPIHHAFKSFVEKLNQ